MATWKTIDDFYEHSNVATVRVDDFNKHKKSKRSKGLSYYVNYSLYLLDKHVGLRHLFLISILTIYSIMGTYYLWYFEGSGEAEYVPAKKAALESKMLEIAQRYKNDNSNLTSEEKAAALKKDYVELLNTDGVFKWSTYYKTDEPDHWKWTFGSSYFYACNVYTTVGYGSIAPETYAAKWFTMLYGTLFCPLTWIIVRDFGQLALVYLTTVYARLKLKFMNADEKAEQVFMLPVWICISICGMIMFFGTLWVYYYDAMSGPPGSGLDWFLSMYFTFQTFTTIGLGDVMPNNIPFEPIICSVFFFSLPMLKVLNRMCYLSMENGVHGAFEVLSNRIYANCHQIEEPTSQHDYSNQLTIHSIATFMQSNADVYGGRLGRVNLRKSDIETESSTK
ncbi:Ion channel [Ancylostoma caninum]|uniref:Ion channel n=1 Tax=Ancylostoma caninum TaxID=29170 RepID=A0A368H6Y2_ANCCA|nr:Ion channel [Ancylostoma caninum]